MSRRYCIKPFVSARSWFSPDLKVLTVAVLDEFWTFGYRLLPAFALRGYAPSEQLSM